MTQLQLYVGTLSGPRVALVAVKAMQVGNYTQYKVRNLSTIISPETARRCSLRYSFHMFVHMHLARELQR